MEFERIFSFPTTIHSIIPSQEIAKLRELAVPDFRKLYSLYERDYLYLPEPRNQSLTSWKADYNAQGSVDRNAMSRDLFKIFDNIIDPYQWNIDEREIKSFLWYRVHAEHELLKIPGLSSDYSRIAESRNAAGICRYLLGQFSLDYLTEASPLTRVMPGTYGEVQMGIFRIISDEYGAGHWSDKHSVLFQGTLASLDMPTDVRLYRNNVINSVYMYMCYVNRIAEDKSLFFRFLGFLFVYEACLIFPTQQQGRLLRAVFPKLNVDTRYFDSHVEIDQDHGVWCVEKILLPIIERYGAEAAQDILRGYHETNLLLELCDLEIKEELSKLDT
jgi:hypothetical protein